jgi:hypothetical protein
VCSSATCVLILLYAATYVSSYYYLLPYMCPHTTHDARTTIHSTPRRPRLQLPQAPQHQRRRRRQRRGGGRVLVWRGRGGRQDVLSSDRCPQELGVGRWGFGEGGGHAQRGRRGGLVLRVLMVVVAGVAKSASSKIDRQSELLGLFVTLKARVSKRCKKTGGDSLC